jgi:hypothetical protein
VPFCGTAERAARLYADQVRDRLLSAMIEFGEDLIGLYVNGRGPVEGKMRRYPEQGLTLVGLRRAPSFSWGYHRFLHYPGRS